MPSQWPGLPIWTFPGQTPQIWTFQTPFGRQILVWTFRRILDFCEKVWTFIYYLDEFWFGQKCMTFLATDFEQLVISKFSEVIFNQQVDFSTLAHAHLRGRYWQIEGFFIKFACFVPLIGGGYSKLSKKIEFQGCINVVLERKLHILHVNP